MRRTLQFAALIILLGGCSAVPFHGTVLVPLDGRQPSEVVDTFRRNMPERFRALSSIVFEFAWNRMSALGVTEVDSRAGTFTAVAMNPMGVKLFEITGSNSEVDPRFMLEAFQRRGDAAQAIGEDIRRIYLGLFPSAEASVQVEPKRIVFQERQGDGLLEHVFAGEQGFLVEKAYREGNETVWRVRYYEYERTGGKAYPRGIVFDNLRYGYRLIVRVKEILA